MDYENDDRFPDDKPSRRTFWIIALLAICAAAWMITGIFWAVSAMVRALQEIALAVLT